MLNFGFTTQKMHILAGTASFNVFSVTIRAGALAVGDLKNPKNSRVRVPTGREIAMRRNETLYPIWIKFCRVVGIPT